MRRLLLIPGAIFTLFAQQPPAPGAAQAAPATAPRPSGNDETLKKIDDLMWRGFLAVVYYTSY